MKQRKVLIATYYWPPSGGAGVQRFLKFCKYLPQFGIQPTVLTVENPTYPILDKSLGKEIPSGVEIVKTRTYEPFSIYSAITGKDKSEATKPTITLKSKGWKSQLSRWIRANVFIPDARVGWTFTAKSKALELIQQQSFDAIITTGPPHSTHFIGKHVKKKAGIRWIADFRDPWSEIHYNQVLPRTSMAEALDRSLEKSVLKIADVVIVVSPSMREMLRKTVARTYHLIPNGFDPSDFDQNIPNPPQNDIFTIRFVGSVREAAIPNALYEAMAQLPDTLNYRLEYIGNVHPEVKKIIKQLGLQDHVSFTPYVPHEEAVRAMQNADLLLLSISKTRNAELILTGKLFDYMGARRPILFIGPTQGDAASIIKELGIGSCFEHGDVAGLKNYLSNVIQIKGSLKIQSLSNKLEEHPYSRIILARKLTELL